MYHQIREAKKNTVLIYTYFGNRTIKEDTLMAHMEATHSSKKGKGHKCTDCSFESNNRTSLSNHIKYMHPSDTTQHPYACDKCAKTFPYASGE